MVVSGSKTRLWERLDGLPSINSNHNICLIQEFFSTYENRSLDMKIVEGIQATRQTIVPNKDSWLADCSELWTLLLFGPTLALIPTIAYLVLPSILLSFSKWRGIKLQSLGDIFIWKLKMGMERSLIVYHYVFRKAGQDESKKRRCFIQFPKVSM